VSFGEVEEMDGGRMELDVEAVLGSLVSIQLLERWMKYTFTRASISAFSTS
jgi:hypothetical protein